MLIGLTHTPLHVINLTYFNKVRIIIMLQKNALKYYLTFEHMYGKLYNSCTVNWQIVKWQLLHLYQKHLIRNRHITHLMQLKDKGE